MLTLTLVLLLLLRRKKIRGSSLRAAAAPAAAAAAGAAATPQHECVVLPTVPIGSSVANVHGPTGLQPYDVVVFSYGLFVSGVAVPPGADWVRVHYEDDNRAPVFSTGKWGDAGAPRKPVCRHVDTTRPLVFVAAAADEMLRPGYFQAADPHAKVLLDGFGQRVQAIVI